MAVCVKVIIDDLINKIDKPYDYYVPDELAEYNPKNAFRSVMTVVPNGKSDFVRSFTDFA